MSCPAGLGGGAPAATYPQNICEGVWLGWVGSSPLPDARTHGQRPYLRDTTGQHNLRLSGLKAYRTVRTLRWHPRERDAAV